MYDVHAGLKGTHRMAAYYVQMARLALLHRFERFHVECRDAGRRCSYGGAEADAVRINDFGGLMRRWAWGAELRRDEATGALPAAAVALRALHLGIVLGTGTRGLRGRDGRTQRKLLAPQAAPGSVCLQGR